MRQFRVMMWEGSVQLRINMRPLHAKFTPYVLGGVGVFRFNPKAYFQGQWVALQALGTEGQGLNPLDSRKYQLTQVNIPVGGGISWWIGERLNMGISLNYRLCFTDYLDDVSTQYYNNDALLDFRGSLAAALADRSAEVIGENNLFSEGETRGNPDSMDAYYTAMLSVQYVFRHSDATLPCVRF